MFTKSYELAIQYNVFAFSITLSCKLAFAYYLMFACLQGGVTGEGDYRSLGASLTENIRIATFYDPSTNR